MASDKISPAAQWTTPPSARVRLAFGYLVEREGGWLELTTDSIEATHVHAVDPVSGDLVVVTIAEATTMIRPREVVADGTLMIFGV